MRQRRTRARIAQLDRQIVGVLRLDHPQSVRHAFYRITAEALPASIMRALVRNAIESLLPAGALDVARAAEESEQMMLLRWADAGRA